VIVALAGDATQANVITGSTEAAASTAGAASAIEAAGRTAQIRRCCEQLQLGATGQGTFAKGEWRLPLVHGSEALGTLTHAVKPCPQRAARAPEWRLWRHHCRAAAAAAAAATLRGDP